MFKDINDPVYELIGRRFAGVTIDYSEKLMDVFVYVDKRGKVINDDGEIEHDKEIIYLELSVKHFLKNAENLSHDFDITKKERETYRNLVHEPDKYFLLSHALEAQAGTDRHFHALLFILAAHIKFGKSAVLYSKIVPGKEIGYTWITIKTLDSNNITIDLFEKTVYAIYRYEDPTGKYQNGTPCAAYEIDESDKIKFYFDKVNMIHFLD